MIYKDEYITVTKELTEIIDKLARLNSNPLIEKINFDLDKSYSGLYKAISYMEKILEKIKHENEIMDAERNKNGL